MEISNSKYDKFRNDYDDALRITNESDRARVLSQIDTRLAERLILDSGSRVQVANLQEATAMVN